MMRYTLITMVYTPFCMLWDHTIPSSTVYISVYHHVIAMYDVGNPIGVMSLPATLSVVTMYILVYMIVL